MIGKTMAATVLTLTMIGGDAAAQTGSAAMPIVVHMRRGTDSIRLTGVLRQNVACCAYSFMASAGQTLDWRVTGPAVRVVVTYPDGHSDGPGVPSPLPLPQSGAYVFAISPDLMADGAFGRFVFTMRIPPLK
jgi:hypothetical protein